MRHVALVENRHAQTCAGEAVRQRKAHQATADDGNFGLGENFFV